MHTATMCLAVGCCPPPSARACFVRSAPSYACAVRPSRSHRLHSSRDDEAHDPPDGQLAVAATPSFMDGVNWCGADNYCLQAILEGSAISSANATTPPALQVLLLCAGALVPDRLHASG